MRVVDLDLAAEQRLLEGQRQLALEVGAAAGERGVRERLDDDDEVAAAGPAPGQLDPGPGVGARRDRDLEPLAVDLDQAGRAVVGLVERDLGGRLVDRRERAARLAATSRRVPAGCRPSMPIPARMSSKPMPPVGRDPRPPDAGEAGAASSPKKTRKKSREVAGIAVARPELVADVAAGPPEAGERTSGRRMPRPHRARLIASQLAPSWSYCLRLAGSPRTSLASLTSLNLRSAAVSPGLASG